MDEDALVKKLHEIERELSGSAEVDVEGCRRQLAAWREREPDQEFRVSVPTPAAQCVLWGWCRRFGIEPYRTPRQRKTTLSVRVPEGFMSEVMAPRVEAMAYLIDRAAAEAAQRIVERWSGMSLAGQEDASAQSELFDGS